MICVAALIVMAVNFACNLVQNGAVQVVTIALQDQRITFGVQAMMSIVFWVLQIWLQLGQAMVMLDVARGRPINLSKLFAGGPFLRDAIFATLILMLIMGGVAAVLIGIPVGVGLAITQSGEGAAVGAGIGVALAGIPIIMITLALFQYQFLIVDRRLGAVDSLRTSYEITRGNKLTLLLLGVVLAAISIAAILVGLLALCVGVIPAMIAVTGFSGLVLAVTYLSMSGQRIVLPGSTADPTSASYGSPVM